MATNQRTKNAADGTALRIGREHYDVPRAWAEWGRHQPLPDDYDRFYAVRICHEYRLVSAPDGPHSVDITEQDDLYVLYRHPETGECVDRRYPAVLVTAADGTVRVWSSASDAADDCVEFPVLRTGLHGEAGEDFGLLPRSVFTGEPANFYASVSVHPDEPRLDATGSMPGGDR